MSEETESVNESPEVVEPVVETIKPVTIAGTDPGGVIVDIAVDDRSQTLANVSDDQVADDAETQAGSPQQAEVPHFSGQGIVISVPLGEAVGHISSSFGLTLSPKAAVNVARVLAGLQQSGVPVNSAADAINAVFESIE